MKTKQSIFAVLSFLSALAASPAPAVDQEMGCKICKECARCRERMEKKMTADAPPPMKPEMKAMPPLQPGPAKPRPIAMPGMGGGPRQPFPGLPTLEKRLAEADLAAILQQYQKVRMMAEEAQTELRLMPESAPDQERVAGRLKVLRSLAEELKKRATACCDKGSKEGKPAKQNPHAGHEKPESDEKSSPAPPEAAPHH